MTSQGTLYTIAAQCNRVPLHLIDEVETELEKRNEEK